MALIINKKARHEYEIDKRFLAGVVLTGQEVKSLRQKHASLVGSYIKIINGEAFLLNAQINPYSFADTKDYDPKRTRKLLLSKKEIHQLAEASKQKNWALVPLAFIVKGRHIKLEFGLARGKKQFEKRAELKRRAVQRDVDRELKQRVRLR